MGGRISLAGNDAGRVGSPSSGNPTNPPTPTYLRYMSEMSGSQPGRVDQLTPAVSPVAGSLAADMGDSVAFGGVGGVA